MTTARTRAIVNTGKGKMDNDLKKSRWIWEGNPEICLQDHGLVDSGCSSHMTGNKAYLSDYEDYNGGGGGGGLCGFWEVINGRFKLLDENQVVLRTPDRMVLYHMEFKEHSSFYDLERMIAQRIAAKTMDDATRQAFEEEKKRANSEAYQY
ncbi:hypothetical protein Tco_1303573 [Tanacetum coccineum]